MKDTTKKVSEEVAKDNNSATSPSEKVGKENRALKMSLIIIGIVVLVAVGVAGYAYYQGYLLRSYATKVETIFNQTSKWNNNDLTITSSAGAKAEVQKVKDDSDKYLAQVNNLSAPAKAKTLDSELKEYFTKAKAVSTQALDMFTYFDEIDRVTKVFTSSVANPNVTSPTAMADKMKQQKTEMQNSLSELNKITVPASMKSYNDSFKKSITDMVTYFDQTSAAVASGNMNALSTITPPLGDTNFGTPPTPNDFEKGMGTNSSRLNDLERLIPAEIQKLKDTNFTF